MWGEHTHISMVEYWRWWVVHLWVEGFFEVFATAVIALPVHAARADARAAPRPSTCCSRPSCSWPAACSARCTTCTSPARRPRSIALGASFSALEVVPLALHRLRGLPHLQARPARRRGWQRYRWPIMFFIAVAFWNLVGAGLFGFLINPPLALYYMQGLNLTPLHGHTALFGVYGMLGIGLMLFCLRGLQAGQSRGTSELLSSCVLVPQHRPRADGAADAAAAWALMQLLGGDRARLLVRALGGVHAAAAHPAAGLDARARRHDLQRRAALTRLVRAAAVDRARA